MGRDGIEIIDFSRVLQNFDILNYGYWYLQLKVKENKLVKKKKFFLKFELESQSGLNIFPQLISIKDWSISLHSTYSQKH